MKCKICGKSDSYYFDVLKTAYCNTRCRAGDKCRRGRGLATDWCTPASLRLRAEFLRFTALAPWRACVYAFLQMIIKSEWIADGQGMRCLLLGRHASSPIGLCGLRRTHRTESNE
jgi:hypothetical protein